MTYVPTRLKREIRINQIITVHYFEYMKDFIFKGESHDFWEFLYVDRGSVYVTAGDRELLLNTGDIVFHEPNEFHAIRSTKAKPPNLVAVSFICDSEAADFFRRRHFTLNEFERDLIARIITEAGAAFRTSINDPHVEQIQLSEKAPFGSPQLILNYIELLLIDIRRREDTDEITLPPAFAQLHNVSSDQQLDTVIQYLERNITERITVDDLCSHFNVSRSYLHNLFKREKGTGIIDFFNRMKIDKAKELIRSGNQTLTEIAHYLSFGSLQYFSKCFKKITGMSPHDYSVSVREIDTKLKGTL